MASNENGDGFIVDLVSNASMNLYPDNKLSSFTTMLPGGGIHLPQPVTEAGYWEVALLDINFPSRFKNITEGLYAVASNKLARPVHYQNLTAGSYQSVGQILDEIHMQIKALYKKQFGIDNINFLSYRHNSVTRRVEIKLHEPGGLLVLCSADLQAVLGYTPLDSKNNLVVLHTFGKDAVHRIPEVTYLKVENPVLALDGWVQGDYPSDIHRLHTILLYTDIIEHQIVGDTTAPLLRVIPLASKLKDNELSTTENSQTTHMFTEPLQFKKIQVYAFHSIHIALYGENGLLIPFDDVGRTSLTLLFRYNQLNYNNKPKTTIQ